MYTTVTIAYDGRKGVRVNLCDSSSISESEALETVTSGASQKKSILSDQLDARFRHYYQCEQ